MIVNSILGDVLVINNTVYEDNRGHFLECYSKNKIGEAIGKDIVQFNASLSRKNVLRGLHFQHKNPQGKLISVLKGKILDVFVDLRPKSKTYKQHNSVVISGYNGVQVYIPEGFAHGFYTLEDDTVVAYGCTNFYDPSSEVTLKWDDSDLEVDWFQATWTTTPILSEKDSAGLSLNEIENKYLEKLQCRIT